MGGESPDAVLLHVVTGDAAVAATIAVVAYYRVFSTWNCFSDYANPVNYHDGDRIV